LKKQLSGLDNYLNNNEFIELLSSISVLDFTEYEIKCIISLVDGEKTPAEIAQVTNIPRPKTYETLDNLLSKKYVKKKETKPISYILEDHALDRILNSLKLSFERGIFLLDELNDLKSRGYHSLLKEKIIDSTKNLGFYILNDIQENGPNVRCISSLGYKIDFYIRNIDSFSEIKNFKNSVEDFESDLIFVITSLDINRELEDFSLDEGLLLFQYDSNNFQNKLNNIINTFEEQYRIMRKHNENIKMKIKNADDIIDKVEYLYNFIIEDFSELSIQNYENIDKELQYIKEEIMYNKSIFEEKKYYIYSIQHDIKYKYKIKNTINEYENIIKSLNEIEYNMKDLYSKLSVIKNYKEEVENNIDAKYKFINKLYPVIPIGDISNTDIINQENFIQKFKEYIKEVKFLNHPSISIIIGEWGSGKTMISKNYVNEINSGKHGKCLATYTLYSDNFISLINRVIIDFYKEAKIDETPNIAESIEKARSNLKQAISLLSQQEYNHFFWFIDETERAFLEKRVEFLHSIRYLHDVSQFMPLSIVLSFETSSYELLYDINPALVRRISHIFVLEKFKVKDIKKLSEKANKIAKFSNESIQLIYKLSEGNPRQIVSILKAALEKSITLNKEIIDIELINSLDFIGYYEQKKLFNKDDNEYWQEFSSISDKNHKEYDKIKPKYMVLLRLYEEGSIVTKKRFNEIGKELGYDIRGLQGFFAWGGKFVTLIAGDRVALTETAVKRLKQLNLIN